MLENKTIKDQYFEDKSKIDSNDARQIKYLLELDIEQPYGEFE
jgi:hypothetical protein